ncbi:hypothetical protein P4C99_22050 [Pontiellaceae bacterium B1224]|nr:hypothetical protein [Pontiellaceae bacterium B1224]
MKSKASFYFYAGVTTALLALAVIPIRRTLFGQDPVVAQLLGPAPSFFGVLALLMLILAAIKPKSPLTVWITAIIVTAGTLTHEILQSWTRRVFDYLDLIAIICGFFVFCLFHIISGRASKKRSNQSSEVFRQR